MTPYEHSFLGGYLKRASEHGIDSDSAIRLLKQAAAPITPITPPRSNPTITPRSNPTITPRSNPTINAELNVTRANPATQPRSIGPTSTGHAGIVDFQAGAPTQRNSTPSYQPLPEENAPPNLRTPAGFSLMGGRTMGKYYSPLGKLMQGNVLGAAKSFVKEQARRIIPGGYLMDDLASAGNYAAEGDWGGARLKAIGGAIGTIPVVGPLGAVVVDGADQVRQQVRAMNLRTEANKKFEAGNRMVQG